MSLRLVDYPSSDENSSDSDGNNNVSSNSNKQSYCDQTETKDTAIEPEAEIRPEIRPEIRSRRVVVERQADAGHVQGGWAGHVFVRINSGYQLRQFGKRCVEKLIQEARDGRSRRSSSSSSSSIAEAARIIGSTEMHDSQRLHISLTRPFYVQEHQISAFVEALQEGVGGYGRFAVGFERVGTYANERGNRGFIAADVGAGQNSLGGLLDRVDRVMERMGKRKFYSRPRFHVSLAWMRVKGEEQIKALEMAGEWLGTAMQEEILCLAATQIDTLECVFGNRQFGIALG